MNKTTILFVCHGNICRSPMAEMIMKNMVTELGMADSFEIASAATDADAIGHDIYYPAKAVLQAHGIPFDSRAARLVTQADVAHYDLFVVMDEENVDHLCRLVGEAVRPKVRLLQPDREIEDPWYTRDFETTFADIEDGCHRLFRELLNLPQKEVTPFNAGELQA